MGRRKIEIRPITHERNRTITFSKRKEGLFKKAYELGVLCSVDIAVIVFDKRSGRNVKLFQYCSGDVNDIVQRQIKHEGPVDIRTPDNVTGKASIKAGDGIEDGDEEEQEDDEDEVEPVPEPEPAPEPPSKKRRVADIDAEPAPSFRPNPLGSTIPQKRAAVSPDPSSSSRAPSPDSEHHMDWNPSPPPHPKRYSRAPYPRQDMRAGPSGSGSRDAYGVGAGGGHSQATTHHADSRRDAYPESSSDAYHPHHHPQGYPAHMLYHPLGGFGRPAPAPSYPYPHPYMYNDVVPPHPHPHPHVQQNPAHTQYPGPSDGANVLEFFAAILGGDGGHAGMKQEDLAGSGQGFDWPVHNQNRNHESARRPAATGGDSAQSQSWFDFK